MNLEAIQAALAEASLDGWLLYDFRGSDPLAYRILGLPTDGHPTRRWFYYIPASGEPRKLVHAIEPAFLDSLPGERTTYHAWRRLDQQLADVLGRGGPTGNLGRATRVAMQYSPMAAIPYIGRVDAGTVELVRSVGCEVVTSADLVQQFEATLTDEQLRSHREAGDLLGRFVEEAFAEIGHRVAAGTPTSEVDIQGFLLERLRSADLVTDHAPIVAVDEHSADPHYAPPSSGSSAIVSGSFVLIDIWAKFAAAHSVYADITWTGYVGDSVPDEYANIFTVVAAARDRAVAVIRGAQERGEPIRGCDADAACRQVIIDAGFGDAFVHRTGHSIHEAGHGNGANLDDLETRDERHLIPRTCFSIEPGIYLPGRFGIRSEIDVYLPDAHSLEITGPDPQTEIVRIGG